MLRVLAVWFRRFGAGAAVIDPRDPRFDTHDGVLRREWEEEYFQVAHLRPRRFRAPARVTMRTLSVAAGAGATIGGTLRRVLEPQTMRATMRPLHARGAATLVLRRHVPADATMARIAVSAAKNPSDEMYALAAQALMQEAERDNRRARRRELALADSLIATAFELQRQAKSRLRRTYPWSDE